MGYSEKSVDFAGIQTRLARDPEGLLKALGLDYRRSGSSVFVTNGPASGANSFVVWIGGQTPGTYKDFASGKHGDMIDLIGHVLGFRGQFEALKWARSYLGLGDAPMARPSAAELARRDAEAREWREKAEAEARKKSLGNHRFWKSLPVGKGTLVETYLREGRGIPLDRLGHFPGALRFQPVAQHINAETGEVTEWPAMVALIQDDTHGLGIHRTYLRPDGSAKAPVKPQKMMHGRVKGGWVPVSRGEGRLPTAELIRRKVRLPVVIGEGIETALTVACAAPEMRVRAALSLSNLILPWPVYASEVVILRENDLKPQAVQAFERAFRHWRDEAAKHGGKARWVASRIGSDFNDMVRA